jgi:hypothetical protein
VILSAKVPFKIEGAWMGMATIHGIARLEADEVVFEYQTQDNVFQVLKTGVKEHRLAIKDVEIAEFNNGWFFGWFSSMTITGHSLKVMQNVPGAKQQTVTFDLERKHRGLAREFVSRLNLLASEHQLHAELYSPDQITAPASSRDAGRKQISEH